MLARSLLILLAIGLGVGSFAVQEPLARAATQITAVVAFYTFFYAPARGLLYAFGYGLAVTGVFLFVSGKSWLEIFAGWELVSVGAWMLIVGARGVSRRSLEAAFIAFIVNRVGDVFWLMAASGAEAFPEGFWIAGLVKAGIFPFTFWLVQAMYAPAPVSALLHSALLVALGVYGPLRYPEWRVGFDAGAQKAAELLAVCAGIGAVGSRSPKVALAWTTGAHLAGVVALWPQPEQAQQALLHHSYLKAALFLLLGWVQRQGYLTLWEGGLAAVLAGLLIAGAHTGPPLLAIAEGLNALALGRLWGRFPLRRKGVAANQYAFLSAPLLLGLLPVAEGYLRFSVPEAFIFIPLGIVGVWLAKVQRYWRLDRPFLLLTQDTLHGWLTWARYCAGMEVFLGRVFVRMAQRWIRLAYLSGLTEVAMTHRGWRAMARRVREALAVFTAPNESLTYAQALRWGFLLTLMTAIVWRFLR